MDGECGERLTLGVITIKSWLLPFLDMISAVYQFERKKQQRRC